MSDFIHRPQIEVLSAADGVRRRQWSDEDKLRIVEESFVGHRQVSATARRHAPCVRDVVRCSTFSLFLRWAG
ncbi:MAG: hypothetical protein CVT70_19140 [Alphaproteobacteria bacterium HGW-Alphaproteobacteria-1]|nr:MAG: hypothetical protein CVT70_19140 [Alphaproteobacteria bacterium HGW-Alphaproteobacteria-1]